ncbi:TetR/AcrR family transcriptional regulator [Stenotrophomonas maltophilia]|uniref:TetR family transcriptional regulator n=1 Tax=Stenotrophomonas maltophilia TaxID=40324 RepID=A0A246IDB6_STEMA|nr:TetR/AcrR family transcriptional regulator [Stenotrophomonas maltophilia]OWQ78026.1 TetR family transcriptional regulator [Stenotrophomonas maltophilia]
MDRKEHLIATALETFRHQGIHAVGINQLLSDAGVSKKTMYNHFESKEELVAATVDLFDERYFEWMEARLGAVASGEAAIKAFFDALDDLINSQDPAIHDFNGCYLVNASAEFQEGHLVREKCAASKRKTVDLIRSHLTELCFEANVLEEAADAIFMLSEGAVVQAYVMGDRSSARAAGKAATRLINSWKAETRPGRDTTRSNTF